MISYDTQELISNVERICSVPLTQMTFTPLDIVAFANNELKLSVVPLMMRVREEYFVKEVDVVPDSEGIIPIPSDAVGAKLEYVMAVNNQCFIKIPRMDLGVIASNGNNFNFGISGNLNAPGGGGFYVQGNNIHLYPKTLLNTYNQNVRLYYFVRTLVLAEPSAYGRITSIDFNTNTVELSNVPVDWDANTVVNIQQGTPNEFKILIPSISVVSTSDPSVVLSGSLTGVNIGDYVSAEGYAAIPQIPVEVHTYLYQLTAAKCMEGLGDSQALKNAIDKAEAFKNDLIQLITSRVEGQPKKIVNTNRFGRGWGNRFGRRF